MLKTLSVQTRIFSNKSLIFLNKCLNEVFRTEFKMDEIVPPIEVRGMKILDREMFTVVKSVPTIVLHQSEFSSTLKIIKKYFLKLNNFRPIQPIPEDYLNLHNVRNINSTEYKIAYLNPTLIKTWNDFEPDTVEAFNSRNIKEDHFQYHDLQITYDNWKCDEILKAILPEDKESVTGYSIVGHIVHLNLREHTFDYKKLIGDVILDKVKNCKTVVNKVNQIDNTFRNFQVEVLSGEDNLITDVKENKCTFKLDFSKVYWNTRLCTEHERIINFLDSGDILFDIFAGVGPFSVPAAKKKCIVFANDLNPESAKWLKHNVELNKVKSDYIKVFNIDGREFIEKIFFEYLTNLLKEDNFDYSQTIHITMNLPALAVTFLNSFVGKLDASLIDKVHKLKIIVYVYCFVGAESPKATAQKLVEENLKCELNEKILKDIFYVRNVAPNKEMMRVSFYLTSEILIDKALNNRKRKRSESN